MTTLIRSRFGIGRSGRAALLCLASFSAAAICAAQTAQPQEPGTATINAEERLPGDAPKNLSTGSPGATAASGQPSEAEMMQMMMEMSKLNENHKLLASLDGDWSYTVKMWMNGDSNSKPQESKGTATRKSLMGGRYVVMDVNGKMEMPGPDGKMTSMDFKGQGLEGYDNAKKKFVGSWIDSMGTGIMTSEGTYDPASKSFTYRSEYEMAPGVKEQVREVVKLTDKDHMVMEWFENRRGQEVKTMEIDYTRKK